MACCCRNNSEIDAMKATAKLLKPATNEEARKTVSLRIPHDLHQRFQDVSKALAEHSIQAPTQSDLLLAAYAEGVDDMEAALAKMKEEGAAKRAPATTAAPRPASQSQPAAQ